MILAILRKLLCEKTRDEFIYYDENGDPVKNGRISFFSAGTRLKIAPTINLDKDGHDNGLFAKFVALEKTLIEFRDRDGTILWSREVDAEEAINEQA